MPSAHNHLFYGILFSCVRNACIPLYNNNKNNNNSDNNTALEDFFLLLLRVHLFKSRNFVTFNNKGGREVGMVESEAVEESEKGRKNLLRHK